MAGPKYDIVAVRKDGEEQTFTNYKGEEQTSKFRKVGAIWERDGKLSMSLEVAITDEDISDCWLNLFSRNKEEGKKPSAPKKQSAPKKSPAAKKPVGPAKKAPPPDQDPFNGDDSDLDY